jgi:hypothetical protein
MGQRYLGGDTQGQVKWKAASCCKSVHLDTARNAGFIPIHAVLQEANEGNKGNGTMFSVPWMILNCSLEGEFQREDPN